MTQSMMDTPMSTGSLRTPLRSTSHYGDSNLRCCVSKLSDALTPKQPEKVTIAPVTPLIGRTRRATPNAASNLEWHPPSPILRPTPKRVRVYEDSPGRTESRPIATSPDGRLPCRRRIDLSTPPPAFSGSSSHLFGDEPTSPIRLERQFVFGLPQPDRPDRRPSAPIHLNDSPIDFIVAPSSQELDRAAIGSPAANDDYICSTRDLSPYQSPARLLKFDPNLLGNSSPTSDESVCGHPIPSTIPRPSLDWSDWFPNSPKRVTCVDAATSPFCKSPTVTRAHMQDMCTQTSCDMDSPGLPTPLAAQLRFADSYETIPFEETNSPKEFHDDLFAPRNPNASLSSPHNFSQWSVSPSPPGNNDLSNRRRTLSEDAMYSMRRMHNDPLRTVEANENVLSKDEGCATPSSKLGATRSDAQSESSVRDSAGERAFAPRDIIDLTIPTTPCRIRALELEATPQSDIDMDTAETPVSEAPLDSPAAERLAPHPYVPAQRGRKMFDARMMIRPRMNRRMSLSFIRPIHGAADSFGRSGGRLSFSANRRSLSVQSTQDEFPASIYTSKPVRKTKSLKMRPVSVLKKRKKSRAVTVNRMENAVPLVEQGNVDAQRKEANKEHKIKEKEVAKEKQTQVREEKEAAQKKREEERKKKEEESAQKKREQARKKKEKQAAQKKRAEERKKKKKETVQKKRALKQKKKGKEVGQKKRKKKAYVDCLKKASKAR